MTIQTVRPDATGVTTGGIVGVGGGVTIHGALNDASDTTGVTATGDNKYAVLGLANPGVAMTATQRVRAWRIRGRVARTAADVGHMQRMQVKLRDAQNRLGTTDTFAYNSTTVKEIIGPWRSTGIGNVPWTNTLLNAVRVDVVWPTRTNGANEWLEARGLFVDFDYNDQPTVSGIDISGATTTSLPDVIWTSADADGDPQTAYRAKVFVTSDTAAGGFNPATSTLAKWDSGVQQGNAQNVTVTKPLNTGVNYTPYVQVAQDWDGPEGTLWWSPWTIGTARTVTPSAPAAPTAALTPILTLPDYRILHTVTAGSPGGGTTNEVEVQVLEKLSRIRGNHTNWAHPQISSCGGVTMDTSGFYSRLGAALNTYPLDTASPAGGDLGGRMISWNPSVGAFSGLDIGSPNAAWTDDSPPYLVPCVPGVPFRISLWVRARTGAASFPTRIVAFCVDATNTAVAGGGFNTFSPLTANTTWQRMELAFTPPANTVYCQFSMENSTPVTGIELLLHGISTGPDIGALQPQQEGIGIYLKTPPDSSWSPLREQENLAGLVSGAKAYVMDNEIIPGRPVIYRARCKTVVSGLVVAGPWTYYNSYVAPPATSLLRDPYDGEHVIKLKRDGRTSTQTDEDASIWHASGRDGDPIKMTDYIGAEDGQLKAYYETAQEKRRLQVLANSARPLLLQWHDGGATYLQFGSRSYEIWDKDAGAFTGDYIGKDRP